MDSPPPFGTQCSINGRVGSEGTLGIKADLGQLLTKNWSILGGYRTFSTHPTDMMGVGLTTLALYKPQTMPLIALDLSPQLMVWWTPKGLRDLGRFGEVF